MKAVVRLYLVANLAVGVLVATVGNCSASIITHKSFEDMRKQEAQWSRYLPPAGQRELALIGKMIDSTPRSRRAEALGRMARATKWGSPERAAAYCVCAWYGVNYARSRDYLLNVLFWSGIGHRFSSYPQAVNEDTVDILYHIYERNHDFVLLHELLVHGGDGAVGEVLDVLRVDALRDHPRGVLHSAAISQSGFNLALSVLMNQFIADVDREELDRVRRVFNVYIRRVAADRQDTLNTIARKLLRKSSRRASGSVRLKVDGKLLRTTPPPVLRHGRVFVPVVAFQRIGLGVEFQGRTRASVGWPDSAMP
jgi:hypothetical protein